VLERHLAGGQSISWRRNLPQVAIWFGVSIGAAALAVGVLVLFLEVLSLPSSLGGAIGGLLAAPLFIGAMIGFYVVVNSVESIFDDRRARREFVEQGRPRLEADLADGRASVERIEVDAVIEISPIDDEGPGLLLGRGERGTLVLCGPELDDRLGSEEDWPSTALELIHSHPGGTWIGIRPVGERLAGDRYRVVEAETLGDPWWEDAPHGRSFPGTTEAVLEQLRSMASRDEDDVPA